MKVPYLSLFCTTLFLFASYKNGKSQSSIKNNPPVKSEWTSNNPFGTNVFVENLGQFDNWAKTSSPVKYAMNNNDKIFFTQQGLTFKLEKEEKIREEEQEKEEGKKNGPKTEPYFVTMYWEGYNPNATIEVNKPTEEYYTFGEKGFENIKAKGYRKLIYKNLYPQIDVEYIIADKGGIKYSLIVHPGADLSVVKMRYEGNVKKIYIDRTGNVIIKTPVGNIIDHAPQSFYVDDKTTIPSVFEVKRNTVSFQLITHHAPLTTIIIDPWTITPSSLTTDLSAYDVDGDDYGNVYVGGGTYPFKLAKYSSAGTLLWIFTNPSGFASIPNCHYYSKFYVYPPTGTTYIGESFNNNPGTRVMRINNDGTLAKTSPAASGNRTTELWGMHFQPTTKQVIGFGGGGQVSNNLQIFPDTNLNSSSIYNFNSSTNMANDIASFAVDSNGDFYAIISTKNSVLNNNHIQKSIFSSSYSPNVAWNVNSGYDYSETSNYVIGVKANTLTVNKKYLFSYDGKTLIAWDKTNGAKLASTVVSASYYGGQNRGLGPTDGIAADECNNVYVGGYAKVHTYTFNGSAFTAGTPITQNIPNYVFDVSVNKTANTLYVSGYGFVTTISLASSAFTLKDSVNSCLGYASVTVSGGTAPYTYLWSNGTTTNSISGVAAGTYTVTVSDNSCIVSTIKDTVKILSNLNINLGKDTAICGTSLKLDAGISSATYKWSTGASTQTITVNTSGMYWVEVTLGSCKNRDTINVTFTSATPVKLGNDTTICGNSLKLDAGILSVVYLWSTGATTQTITVNTSGMYWVEVTSSSCKNRDTINVTFASVTPVKLGNDTALCGNSLKLDAGISSASYLWSSGATTQTVTVNTSGMYWVEVTSGSCKSRDTINVTFISATSVKLGNDTTVCRNSLKLDAGVPSANYLWSSGATTQAIIVNTSGMYWVKVSSNGCSASDTININFALPPVVSIGDTFICKGEQVFLNPIISGNVTSYYWAPAQGLSSTMIVNPVAAPASTTSYTIEVSNGLCSASDTIVISVNSPVAAFTANPAIGVEPLPVSFINKSTGAVSYEWNFGVGETSPFTLYSPTHIYTEQGTYTVTLIVTDSIGCKDTAVGRVMVNGESMLWIPNAFTPGGGDINEVFSVKSIGLKELKVTIFNRWGELLYEWTDIDGGWDGTFKGKPVQQEVYVYVLQAKGIDGITYHKTGHVTVLR